MADTPTVQAILNKASKDKFTMVLGLPPILQKINTTNQKDRSGDTVNLNALQFSVYGAVVPASFVPHTEARFGGQTLKVTTYSRPSYPNLKVNFAIDNGFRNYFVLYKWLHVLNDVRKSIYNGDNLDTFMKMVKNYHEYMVDLTIYAKDEYDKNIAKFTYTKAFITRLEGIDYNHQDADQIESSFEFAFSQFEMELL